MVSRKSSNPSEAPEFRRACKRPMPQPASRPNTSEPRRTLVGRASCAAGFMAFNRRGWKPGLLTSSVKQTIYRLHAKAPIRAKRRSFAERAKDPCRSPRHARMRPSHAGRCRPRTLSRRFHGLRSTGLEARPTNVQREADHLSSARAKALNRVIHQILWPGRTTHPPG